MFCPFIKDECKGSQCVKWYPHKGVCVEQYTIQQFAPMGEIFDYLVEQLKASWEVQKELWLKDPHIPEEIKEKIREAENIAVARKLLRDSGLI